MGFADAIRTCLTKYATFQGRAVRSEYWYFYLFVFIVSIVASVIDGAILGQSILSPLAMLALLLPNLAVGVRRLHDIDRSGWWLLIGLTGIGVILLIVWFCTAGTPGPNRFSA